MKRRVLSIFMLAMALFVVGANTYVLIAPLVLGPNNYHDNPYFSFIRWALTGVLLTIIALEWRYRRRGKTIQRNEKMSKFSLLVIMVLVIVMAVIFLISTLIHSF